jgi:hypothetical protein
MSRKRGYYFISRTERDLSSVDRVVVYQTAEGRVYEYHVNRVTGERSPSVRRSGRAGIVTAANHAEPVFVLAEERGR